MNLRIPARIEPRLRAHASRLGMSLNATATHLLGAHLPEGLEPTMVRWVDAQGPPSPRLPATELPPLEELFPVSLCPPCSSQVHVAVPTTPVELRLEPMSWTTWEARGLRVQVVRNPTQAQIVVKGPWLRRSGQPAQLLEHGGALGDGQIHPLRGPVNIHSTDKLTLSVEADTQDLPLMPVVSVELMGRVIRDDAFGPVGPVPVPNLDAPLGISRPGWEDVELPVRVPLLSDDGSPLIKLGPGESVHTQSLTLPWCAWRLGGLELEVDADPGAEAVSVADFRIGGGPHLHHSLSGLSARSLQPGSKIRLRCCPFVMPPNSAMAEIRLEDPQPCSALRPKRQARVTGYAVGRILQVKRRLVGELDEEAIAAGEGLDEITR